MYKPIIIAVPVVGAIIGGYFGFPVPVTWPGASQVAPVSLSASVEVAISEAASFRSQAQAQVTPAVSKGLWLSEEEILKLPISGAAWDALQAKAREDAGVPHLNDMEDDANVIVLAKALVFVRQKNEVYRKDVETALQSIVSSPQYQGTALALGRELGAYVIAADLIGLSKYNPELHAAFKKKIKELLTAPTTRGPANLILCHERRPNNWGTHCGASRIAVALYLHNTEEVKRAAKVFKGWLGDTGSYNRFSYGSDKTWHCNADKPVGINPRGCVRGGHSIDGVLPDDERRGGSFGWPPPKENYVWGALQGAVVQAELLHRAGYDVWNWEDKALLRAVKWLYKEARYSPKGDDTWVPYLINRAYGVNFSSSLPSRPGKNMGFTDWSHSVRP